MAGLFLCVLTAVLLFAVTGARADGWKLVWHDEFDKDGPPNPANWDFEHGFIRTLGKSIDTLGWPKCGEVDIMEYYRNMLLSNVCHSYNGQQKWTNQRRTLEELGGAAWTKRFHVWTMEWNDTKIDLLVDGKRSAHFNVTDDEPGKPNAFRNPHYLLLNQAIGGASGGDPSQTTFPVRLEVDWVRVYQRQEVEKGASASETRSFKEQTVQFVGTGGATISGTIAGPSKPSPDKAPAVVLLQGSGPTDRNGNGAGMQVDTLRKMAEALAAEGVVTLRYDKRGQFGSPITEAGKTDLAEFCRWSNYVKDAEAALQTLRARPDVDRDRTGFLGHSEGGLIALQAANELQASEKPAVLILAATGGRRLGEILHDQIARALKTQKATPEQTQYYLSQLERITSAIQSTGTVPKDVPAGLAALFPAYLGPFLQGVASADPVKFASSFTGPVLLLQGAADVQVSATKDAPLLDDALKSRPEDRHKTIIIPHASHNFRIVAGESEDGLTGPFATQVLYDLRTWVRAELFKH